MDIFEFLKKLPGYNFSSDELKIIKSILSFSASKSGESPTADDISADCGVPKAKVYGALKQLERKKVVTKVPGQRPAKFVLISPDDLQNKIKKVTNQVKDLMQEYEKVYSEGLVVSSVPKFKYKLTPE